nr:TonB-dependent receptor plug domain-containing protein [uncultured Allomuricauda sp.]
MRSLQTILFLLGFAIVSAQSSQSDFAKEPWKDLRLDFQVSFEDSLAVRKERVMLQIANNQLNPEEPIFFKGYLATERQFGQYSKSRVMNVELLDSDGELVKRQLHKIMDGTVQGQFNLPKDVASGNYTLKAYTRWSQNYGEGFAAKEQIQVGEPSILNQPASDIVVSIMPEGGTFLSGQKNRIVVKVPSDATSKVATQGRILDEDGQEVTKVSFYGSGLGTALLTPEGGKDYRLEMADGTRFPLPKSTTDGFLLHVNNLDRDNAIVRITPSAKRIGKEIDLIGTSRGITYFKKRLDFADGNSLDVELLKSNLPAGIINLKLVDQLGSELAVRPIWVAREKLHIAIDTLQQDIRNDLKTIKIQVTDNQNRPVKSKLTLSVNRTETANPNKDSDYSESNEPFAFSDIIGGREVSLYRKEAFLRDLEVLTSEEKVNKDLFNDSKTAIVSKKFPYQEGLEIMGHAYDLNNNLLTNTKIQLVATSEQDVWAGEAQTDAQGILKLEQIHIEGTATLVARTEGEDVKSRLVKIIPFNSAFENREKETESAIDKTISEESLSNADSERTIELIEVEVVESGKEKIKQTPSKYGVDVPSHRINHQDFNQPKTLPQLLSELPGVIVRGAETLYPSVQVMGGSGTILWVVDGFPIAQEGSAAQVGTAASSPLNDVMNLVGNRDVERVELLKGPEASMYGSRASAGVFVIYTRMGNELEYVSRSESALRFEGYTPSIDFQDYHKQLSKRKKEKSKLLYWNPDLKTDDNGEIIIRVPDIDDVSIINVEVSAKSKDGTLGFTSNTF